MADTGDLKSPGRLGRAGSSPALGTILQRGCIERKIGEGASSTGLKAHQCCMIVLTKRTEYRTYCRMTIISATKARSQLYRLIDEANDSHEPIQITGKRGNAVLLSESDWSAIQETLYLNSISGLVASIQQSRDEGLDQASEELDW